ncbi:MAG: hypothetical protein WCR72_01595 [Bacteroidota bacterium]
MSIHYNTARNQPISGNWAGDALGLAQGLNSLIPFNTIGVGTRAKVVAEEQRLTDKANTNNKILLYSVIGVILTILAIIIIKQLKK